MDVILKRLMNDEVVTFENVKSLNAFYDYLIAQGLEPDDFRQDRFDIWKA